VAVEEIVSLGTWPLTSETERDALAFLIAHLPADGRYEVEIRNAVASVGPYTIRQRSGTPPPGLSFLPTLEPDLSDDADTYPSRLGSGIPFTDCTRAVICEAAANALVIVEIGVADYLAWTVSLDLMHNKPPGAVYIGIDKVDRRHYQDQERGIHVICCDSANRQPCFDLLDSLERQYIDLLFIDGWHSVNQCLADWRYTERLAPNGTVLIHDTNHHPGPAALLAAIDPAQWDKRQACPDPNDYGIAVVRRCTSS
jgi:hypothetical protein